jgi:hypothetical protein
LLAFGGVAGRRLCAAHRDGAVPLLRLKRSQLARAQAFAARTNASLRAHWRTTATLACFLGWDRRRENGAFGDCDSAAPRLRRFAAGVECGPALRADRAF